MSDVDTPLVLIVDDEPAQVALLSYNLKAAGFRIATAKDGEEAVLAVAELGPDVILLDWMLPRLSGLEACRQIRATPEGREASIIMVSARSEEGDRVRGLDTGADDYIIKPYSVAELIARVRANLRRLRPTSTGQALQYNDIRLEPDSYRVMRGNENLHLGPTEFRLLAAFMERPGKVWTREALLDRVWGRDIYIDTRTVDVHVGRLRKTLCAAGGDDPIRTVRGAGYAMG
ncbi:phosphate regulon transcriptional regulator PhoB [Roseinatronobacter bogoriensis]|uniref:Phosphate regulon transcriptional regulatory protein PhoB n=1 Tax=Roseinatronobacter bogoriensis subsp. barguzinensis TaxID=441209 RepID=A0A2K8KJD4_9RHOB|nr:MULTISPECIES: phosphate regulon transcriptional regulator PhoB [Rhodobaca]ATX67038.1 phosphate regulon transcriptional regulatory protein PhoB [Rhodobaca barguzinensis]MBB4206545.1 two-component system phosphate regulon response regulator PhoB [Rhodobaca bogoriensis DSM 18756]TDW41288.1 two-component system phosphate regulon response regulator PhoB [Rhodobaca barguzinensis]TDY74534.1 two-component system phosphate regulon response regulator PhoB [Rhodobaca bogoriensis DSM 18756]